MARISKKQARDLSPASEARQVRTKLSAFEERYDTANKSNEEVLSKSESPFHSIFIFLTSSHFKVPVITVENIIVKYQFICHM